MLEHGIIEPSQNPWSSSCVLVLKADGTWRFCTDFRKVNNATKSDCFPLPRIEDCIDCIVSSQFVSKFDLLKGYWQVPLSEEAKAISAFVTPDGLYQYTVMPFGMRNAPATFQQMINHIKLGMQLKHVVLKSLTVHDYIVQIRSTTLQSSYINKFKGANLTVNLTKS